MTTRRFKYASGLELLLHGLKAGHLFERFQANKIKLGTLEELSDMDLIALGIDDPAIRSSLLRSRNIAKQVSQSVPLTFPERNKLLEAVCIQILLLRRCILKCISNYNQTNSKVLQSWEYQAMLATKSGTKSLMTFVDSMIDQLKIIERIINNTYDTEVD